VIITRRIAARIALVVLVGVILQVSFFSYLSFFGATPDALTVLIASIGLLGGALVGAVTGFAAGLLLDSALLQVLGVSSLALLVAGYLTGRYREGFAVEGRLRPALLIGGVTLLATAIFAALQIMLGVSTQVSLLVFREIFVKGLLGTLLAFGIYPLVRRVFRGAIVDDPRPGSVRERPPVTATPAAPSRRAFSRRASRRRPRARSVSSVGRGPA
jgi:rod shape-determining protein MreD